MIYFLILKFFFISLAPLSHSLDDISTSCSWSASSSHQAGFQSDHVLTIEELRFQMTSCFTCGVSWADHHVSLDCSECGGYALERSCPECEGVCGAVWKRDLTMVIICLSIYLHILKKSSTK